MNKEKTLKKANDLCKNTLMETLGIRFVDIGTDFVSAEMMVNTSVHQPEGILHGGATLALAETVASAACVLLNPSEKPHFIRGIEISANHLKPVTSGVITATAKALHYGKTTQLWIIRVVDQKNRLVAICKQTTMKLNSTTLNNK